MVQNEEAAFSREDRPGGAHFTETLVDLSRSGSPAKVLSYEAAEQIKMNYGIPTPGLEQDQTEEGIPLEEIHDGRCRWFSLSDHGD